MIILYASQMEVIKKNDHIPESLICNSYGIKLIDNLGDKIQSSSWILKGKK